MKPKLADVGLNSEHLLLIFWKYLTVRSEAPPISMQYVVNFTSKQYVLILVNTGDEGTLSTSPLGRQAWASTYSPAAPK